MRADAEPRRGGFGYRMSIEEIAYTDAGIGLTQSGERERRVRAESESESESEERRAKS